jgi:prepilin-type processing-associated H-X9-DG protein
MVILVSETSNRYTHLFLVEREYFGFNTLECYCSINMKYLAYMNILFGDNHVQTVEIGKKGGCPEVPPWY